MRTTTVTVLTPTGVGAVAILSLAGPNAWTICRELFDRDLPSEPPQGGVWVGRFGLPPGDDVVLAVKDDAIEVQCHGGHSVVQWLVTQCVLRGACALQPAAGGMLSLLPHTLTVRTAAIILDQLSGATGDGSRYADIGRHLTRPWRVVVAGPPNAGKSSLVNALAGYTRSVVSPMAGTTRDAASVAAAFDGWPVELIDTAGVRATDEQLETAGIAATFAVAKTADLVLWVTAPDVDDLRPPFDGTLQVAAKCDLGARPGLAVSAATGDGLAELVAAIVNRLVPDPPPPGAAVSIPLR